MWLHRYGPRYFLAGFTIAEAQVFPPSLHMAKEHALFKTSFVHLLLVNSWSSDPWRFDNPVICHNGITAKLSTETLQCKNAKSILRCLEGNELQKRVVATKKYLKHSFFFFYPPWVEWLCVFNFVDWEKGCLYWLLVSWAVTHFC